ncbi:MAG: inosine-5-monophosphate dehydrogenase [Bdellovibrionales bacterium RBG_16_40_8]|nr:MAG: inosine-5-monophosphate dehydrogenase [Bdellovibrionales bacterium RBG_16_40_8]
MQVREIMNKKVDVINYMRSAKEAAKMMKMGDYGSLPVERDDKMVGMITDRDITLRVVGEDKDPNITKVQDCMSKGINYCFDTDDIKVLADKMKSSRHRRIPVVNKDKKLVGIVSTRELLTKVNDHELSYETMAKIC